MPTSKSDREPLTVNTGLEVIHVSLGEDSQIDFATEIFLRVAKNLQRGILWVTLI